MREGPTQTCHICRLPSGTDRGETNKAPRQNETVLPRGAFVRPRETPPKVRSAGGEDRKKVLSLVLCVAMMLSVMVMGAGAAFTDQDKIVNEEAVDMISALGIVDGYENDSFQPSKNIERGEAAKMIAVMLTGGKDAVQDTSVSSFNDVLGSADAWANKYIEYGVSKRHPGWRGRRPLRSRQQRDRHSAGQDAAGLPGL